MEDATAPLKGSAPVANPFASKIPHSRALLGQGGRKTTSGMKRLILWWWFARRAIVQLFRMNLKWKTEWVPAIAWTIPREIRCFSGYFVASLCQNLPSLTRFGNFWEREWKPNERRMEADSVANAHTTCAHMHAHMHAQKKMEWYEQDALASVHSRPFQVPPAFIHLALFKISIHTVSPALQIVTASHFEHVGRFAAGRGFDFNFGEGTQWFC